MDKCGTRGQSGPAEAAEHGGLSLPDLQQPHHQQILCQGGRDRGCLWPAQADLLLPASTNVPSVPRPWPEQAGGSLQAGTMDWWGRRRGVAECVAQGLFPPCDTGVMSQVCVISEHAEEASAPSPQLLRNKLNSTGANLEPWGLHQWEASNWTLWHWSWPSGVTDPDPQPVLTPSHCPLILSVLPELVNEDVVRQSVKALLKLRQTTPTALPSSIQVVTSS